MPNKKPAAPRNLGQAEQAVMNVVWAQGPVSADACRDALAEAWPMKESTIRTVLRRLEEKRYVTHVVEGRTYMYSAAESPINVAARSVKQLIDRFCGGSAERLVIGLVDNEVVDVKQLERLARSIAQQKGRRK